MLLTCKYGTKSSLASIDIYCINRFRMQSALGTTMRLAEFERRVCPPHTYFSLSLSLHLNLSSLDLNQGCDQLFLSIISSHPSLALSTHTSSVHPHPILLRRHPRALPSPTMMGARPHRYLRVRWLLLPDPPLVMTAPTLTRRQCSPLPPTPPN
ncbi:hypothetical protein SEVIR_5G286801v4 [Setaria viridis]